MSDHKTPEELAAQLWCLPQHAHKEMDVDFAISIATAIHERDAEAGVKRLHAWIDELEAIREQNSLVEQLLADAANMRVRITELENKETP